MIEVVLILLIELFKCQTPTTEIIKHKNNEIQLCGGDSKIEIKWSDTLDMTMTCADSNKNEGPDDLSLEFSLRDYK